MSLSPALTGVASAYPLPNTTPTPAVGELVKASDVQLAAQGLLNQDMALQAQVNLKAPIASPTFTGTLTTPALSVTNNAIVGGSFGVTGTSTLGGNSTAAGTRGIALTGTAPAATADPGANNLVIGALQCKAWLAARVGTSVAILDGINIASLSLSMGNLQADVVFARPMANAFYSIGIGVYDVVDYVSIIGKTANGFSFAIFDTSTFSAPRNLSLGTRLADFQIIGRQ